MLKPTLCLAGTGGRGVPAPRVQLICGVHIGARYTGPPSQHRRPLAASQNKLGLDLLCAMAVGESAKFEVDGASSARGFSISVTLVPSVQDKVASIKRPCSVM